MKHMLTGLKKKPTYTNTRYCSDDVSRQKTQEMKHSGVNLSPEINLLCAELSAGLMFPHVSAARLQFRAKSSGYATCSQRTFQDKQRFYKLIR